MVVSNIAVCIHRSAATEMAEISSNGLIMDIVLMC
jgi:hypothetical protein